MKIAFHNVYDELNRDNFLFENVNTSIGDELLLPFNLLREYAKSKGIECGTTDYFKDEDIDAYVFIDFPENKNVLKKAIQSKKPLFLIIFESELIKPKNWNLKNHNLFSKIFTWNDDYVDNIKYFKINFSQKVPEPLLFKKFSEKKLMTLIASNKIENLPGELYTERIRAIRWFEKNKPNDFDLYGMGWDKNRFHGRLKFLNAINKLPFKVPRLQKKYPSYRGAINNKREILGNYKYSICFENYIGPNGYITEKIFDCFFSGVVPIYQGPPNLNSFFPKDIYIDYSEFNDYEDLFKYLKSIDEDQYSQIQEKIKLYLKSQSFYQFSCEYFSETIIKNIINSVQKKK